MRDWFKRLDPGEQDARQRFQDAFDPVRKTFLSHPLTKERNIVSHRTGVTRVVGKISGLFGATYTSDPLSPAPGSEPLRSSDGEWIPGQRQIPIEPYAAEFTVDGKPLFPLCQDYIAATETVVQQAQAIAQQVHGGNKLTSPPG
jgi:hypothetical protein